MSTQRRRGRAWKPDATGKRCVRCARTWDGHAGTSCYPVPDPAIDAFDPARPELLELADGDDTSRRTSPSRPGDPVDERDGSLVDERDTSVVSRVDAVQTGRLCAWCNDPIPTVSPSGRRTRADAETCGVICRKRRNRFLRAVRDGAPVRKLSRRADASRLAGAPARFAYADPPYPGCAHYYDERQEVDHAALIARLVAQYPDGWALSTSSAALRDILVLCPPDTRVCAWRRRVRVSASKRALSAWEPLLVVGGREHRTDVSQELLDDLQSDDVVLDDVLDYRGRYDSFNGALVGMKPPEFAVWMFAQLGARPGDTLDDLYPGSGAVGRAWALYASLEKAVGAEPSRLEPDDASRGAAAIRPGRQADVGQDASRTATAGPRDSS